jgi:hypothetical protein
VECGDDLVDGQPPRIAQGPRKSGLDTLDAVAILRRETITPLVPEGRSMTRRDALAVLCCAPATLWAAPPQERTRPGVVFVVEGIGGIDLIKVAADLGFGWAGLPHEVRRFYWSHGFGRFLRDLQDRDNVLAKGEELAGEVLALKRQEPARPIYLLGQSGGTGVVVRAAGCLPADSIERVILLASALSPYHDLRPALAATRCGIVSYHSRADRLFLDWGTRRFGTIDGALSSAAGHVGFVVPRELSPADHALYQRLVQIRWTPGMMLSGNFGGHNGSLMPGFLAAEVARWLR